MSNWTITVTNWIFFWQKNEKTWIQERSVSTDKQQCCNRADSERKHSPECNSAWHPGSGWTPTGCKSTSGHLKRGRTRGCKLEKFLCFPKVDSERIWESILERSCSSSIFCGWSGFCFRRRIDTFDVRVRRLRWRRRRRSSSPSARSSCCVRALSESGKYRIIKEKSKVNK